MLRVGASQQSAFDLWSGGMFEIEPEVETNNAKSLSRLRQLIIIWSGIRSHLSGLPPQAQKQHDS
jgi:hypothetical protein